MESALFDPHLNKRKKEIVQSNRTSNKSPPTAQNSQRKTQQDEALDKLIASSQNILMRIDTIWPFDLFPDTLLIDPIKLTYTHRSFFMVAYTESILLSDLIETDVEMSPIFATLRISFVSYPTRQILIKPLWKLQAQKAREIIAGLRLAHKRHFPVEKLPTDKIQILEAMESHDDIEV